MQINPYLMFSGNCEEAFRYYEKHLGGKIVAMMKYSDAPPMPQGQSPPETGHGWAGPVFVSLRLERQRPCATTAESCTFFELASSPAKELSRVPPGALMIAALLVTSHLATGATGILTVMGISTFSPSARSGLLLLH